MQKLVSLVRQRNIWSKYGKYFSVINLNERIILYSDAFWIRMFDAYWGLTEIFKFGEIHK